MGDTVATTPSPLPPRRTGIPLELLKYIMDFLPSCALKQCALTCKDWLPISRYYLLLVIDDWYRGIRHTYSNFLQLLEIDEDADAGSAGSARFWRHLKIQSESVVEASDLFKLLSKLPNVQSLEVRLERILPPLYLDQSDLCKERQR